MAEVAKGLEKLISNGINSKYLTENYILPLEERPKFSSNESPSESIPVIDLNRVSDGLGQQNIIRKISKASEDYEFFQIIIHGVPEDIIQGMLGVATEFFEMPIEERAKLYSEDPETQVRVCTSLKSKIQLWRDILRHPCHPLEDYINSWPLKPENYREVANKYALEIRVLILKLLTLLSEGLGLDSDYLNEKFGKHNQIQLINYYPPCPDPNLTLRLPGHSDPNGITVLLQVLKEGKCIIVKLEKNDFVVNIADQLQVISNGSFKSVEHGTITNCTFSRISLPTFYGPSLDALIGPTNELVSKESPAIYRSYTFGEFFDSLTGSIW
ncbi:protein DMR6-LIKE OXYGENASE 1-like [Amborella trichopoda]|uniref:protein DMR6-LIKE OXYGENASE 1-like n=1 Tax=Amborella trichopoda TaxID=13333 RepID=UPI0009C0A214|nr:protein DMR6-LIKE OXYGENASE 1-like [Amborella trichopoda]|eukprot:XP_020525818.1 protein DMR6-LIKE OXYGENASE 1-like [Amborella trichopoda]